MNHDSLIEDSAKKTLIERVVNVFETGKPEGDYANITIYRDGPHNIRQITYGRSQTTEYGKLRQLVEMYVAANGQLSADLASYAPKVGSVALTDDADFKALLRRAGKEDTVMRRIQDEFFDKAYYQPAIKWADDHTFTLPLSALVIYDSFIHSGSILWLLRQKFSENPPSLGGDERKWISSYVDARHDWLSTHPREVVRKTIYRTQCFKREIVRQNWDLSQLPINANGVNVTSSP